MSKLYLQADVAEIVVANPMAVYGVGAGAGESVAVTGTARAVVLDQNIDQINLQGLASTYTFQQAGNQLRVLSSNALMVTVSVQDDANGTLMRFGDGTIVSVSMSSQGVMTLGGATVSTTAGSVTPISAGVPAGAITGSGSSAFPQGRLYLEAGDPTMVVSNAFNVYGSGSTADAIQITTGTAGVVCDQNMEQVSLPSANSAYAFQQGGNQLRVYQGATLVATLPLQDDSNGTLVSFTDGTFEAKLGSTGIMTLGNATVPSNAPAPVAGGGTSVSLLSQAQAKSMSNAATGALLTSSDPTVVGMLIGTSAKWTGTNLTYSFPTTMPTDYIGKADYSSNWSALNIAEQSAVRSVFSKLAEIVPLHLTEVSGSNGDLRFSVVDQAGSSGFAVTPAENRPFFGAEEGDVFLATSNRSDSSISGYQPKDNGFLTVLHEVGHAVGLKHPFESPVVPQGTDNQDYSVMSYTEARNLTAKFTKNGNSANVVYDWLAMDVGYAVSDVSALQVLYGANMQTRTGDSSYSVSSRDNEYLCIWDAGGNDTINAASATGVCRVNLNSGTFSTIDLWPLEQQKAATLAQLGQGFSNFINSAYGNQASHLYTGENNLSIAHGAVIENVTTGSANDTVIDSKYNNQISTGAGDDVIELGSGGFDTVDGGSGFDTVSFASVNKSQIQQELQSDGSLLLLGSTFAVRLIGVESVSCADGILTLLA